MTMRHQLAAVAGLILLTAASTAAIAQTKDQAAEPGPAQPPAGMMGPCGMSGGGGMMGMMEQMNQMMETCNQMMKQHASPESKPPQNG